MKRSWTFSKFHVATPNNAAQLQKMVQAAFRAEDSRGNWTADMALSAGFRIEVEEVMAMITKPNCAILMATDDNGALVASAEVSRRSADLARLSMLAVDQQRQRGSIGRQVLANAEDYCRRTWGVNKMGLNALSTRKELILWYMRCGYRKTGELSPFPHERTTLVPLPDGLCFVELEKDLDAVSVAAGTP
ncbi:putative GNAT family acetyltransferase [Xylariales sp. AK1849]|nr:putative GNAT family acetyltransferase [Xylariales sp. AK1849]